MTSVLIADFDDDDDDNDEFFGVEFLGDIIVLIGFGIPTVVVAVEIGPEFVPNIS